MLIVGLGNPGAEYNNTRHNVGFACADVIAQKLGFSWKEASKFKAIIATGVVGLEKILIAKPQTYMNLSGNSVSLIKNYYNIDSKDIVVLHDEIDIPLGEIRYKVGGGTAGHNGLKSLCEFIENDYHRIRIGIGRGQTRDDVSSHVLGHFSTSETVMLNKILDYIDLSTSDLLKKNFTSIVLRS